MTRLIFTFSWLVSLIVILTGRESAYCADGTSDSSASPRLHRLDPGTPEGLQALFRYTGESMPLVSAHRGGVKPGFPENCIATFEHTLQRTFAMMEIDPRYTKDGEIVIHHDATLERTTNGSGRITDRTLAELKSLRLKDDDGVVTGCSIPSLDEVLQWARGKAVLVLDQKDVPVEARVNKIEEHRADAYAMLIVYSFKDARKCYDLNKNIMMEVMIPNREKFHEFDKLGIPWANIVAFVGHTPPEDVELLRMIHAKGTCCIAGTSRNLDRQLRVSRADDVASLEPRYRSLLQNGVDLIETDLPGDVGKLLYRDTAIPTSKSRFFRK